MELPLPGGARADWYRLLRERQRRKRILGSARIASRSFSRSDSDNSSHGLSVGWSLRSGSLSPSVGRVATEQLLRAELGFLATAWRQGCGPADAPDGPITERVRFTGLGSVTRSVTLPQAISTTLTLTELGVGLANAALADHTGERDITLLAITVSNLSKGAAHLPAGPSVAPAGCRP